MPKATPSEFIYALSQTDRGLTMSESQFDNCLKRTLEHHGYSIRFYRTLCPFPDTLECLKAGKPINAHRNALWKVALRLDLQCEPIFAAATLSMCPGIALKELTRMGFKDDQILFDVNVPRRLALAYMLVLTSPHNISQLLDASAPETRLAHMKEGQELIDLLVLLPESSTPGLAPYVERHRWQYLQPLINLAKAKLKEGCNTVQCVNHNATVMKALGVLSSATGSNDVVAAIRNLHANTDEIVFKQAVGAAIADGGNINPI